MSNEFLRELLEEEEPENLFSFWYPKVADCGIPCPQTLIFKTPDLDGGDAEFGYRLARAWFHDSPQSDQAVIQQWVERDIIPTLKEQGLTGHLFVKNGTFSNKFCARTSCSIYGVEELARAIGNINYASLCLGAGGACEVVVRQFIERDSSRTPTIYEGLPLRPEFRVFYDFDRREPIFAWNYWDPEYVSKFLHDLTDQIIFAHERQYLEETFQRDKKHVLMMVDSAMKQVQGLSGQWSVDLMLDPVQDKYWLIDMAAAQSSAYWDRHPAA